MGRGRWCLWSAARNSFPFRSPWCPAIFRTKPSTHWLNLRGERVDRQTHPRHLSSMFIATEETPNPATLKFLPGRAVMGEKPVVDFASVDDAGRSPLAQALFALPGVARVFLGADFITVTKASDEQWVTLKPI